MGSDVPAEVPGAIVVSLSSNLDSLLWAATLFSSVFVILYIAKVLLVFESVVISTKLFMRTFIFFSDVAAHFPLFDYPFLC